MNDQQQAIQFENTLHRYFAMIPHMADDDLDIYEYRLYGHYVRVAGGSDSGCTEGIRKTADKTDMGINKMQEARDSLEQKGYIRTVKPSPEQARQGETIHVFIVDRWAENFARYAHQGVSPQIQGVSQKTQPVSPQIQGGVSQEIHKKNQEKKNHKEEKSQPPHLDKKAKEEAAFEVRWEQHKTTAHHLLRLFGYGSALDMNAPLTKATREEYLTAAEDLDSAHFALDEITAAHAYMLDKSKTWTNKPGIKLFPKYADEKRKLTQPPQTTTHSGVYVPTPAEKQRLELMGALQDEPF